MLMKLLSFNAMAAIAVSLYLLWLLYRMLEIRWPNFYFSLSDSASLYVSISLQRFVLFRMFPIMIVTLPILGTIAKNSPSNFIIILGILIGLSHAVMTNGIAIVKLVRGSSDIATYFNKANQILLHLIVLCLSTAGGGLSGYIAGTDLGQSITPSLAGMVDNIWSTVLVLVIGVYYYKDFNRGVNEDEFILKVSKSISENTKLKIKESCAMHEADYPLTLSVCIAESIQRPKWVRTLEAVKGLVIKRGTYGIMQVRSDKPLSDDESIQIAISQHLARTSLMEYPEKEVTIRRYNGDQRYIDLVFHTYQILLSGECATDFISNEIE